MESASSIPKEVNLNDPAESLFGEFDSSKPSTSGMIFSEPQGSAKGDAKVGMLKNRNSQAFNEILDQINSESLEEYKELLERFEEYENKYIAEFSENEKKNPLRAINLKKCDLDEKFLTNFEDIYEVLESLKHQTFLCKSEKLVTDEDKKYDIEIKEITAKPKEVEEIVKYVEAETSFIIDPNETKEASDFSNFSDDSDFDDEEIDKWENTSAMEVVVHNPEPSSTSNEVAVRRPQLFSTFDIIKRIFRGIFCIPEDDDEEDRRYGLTIQEWMIFSTSVIIFVGCCIIIAFIGLRYRECSKIAMHQDGVIKRLLDEKESLHGFVQGIKNYNTTLYNMLKNEITKQWDK